MEKKKGTSPSENPLPSSSPKKKKRDWKSWATVIIGAVILIMAVAAIFDVEDITKTYVENTASRTLNVPVQIASLSLNPKEKKIKVEGIRVGNPEGFTQPNALMIGAVTMEIAALSPSQLVIERIHAAHPQIILEVVNNKTNLTTIRDNMNRLAAAEAPKENQERNASPPLEVIINFLNIDTAQLDMSFNGEQMRPIPIPPLEISQIGAEGKGVLSSQAMGRIIDHLTRHVIAAAVESGHLQNALSANALQNIKSGLQLDFKGQAQKKMESLGKDIRGFLEEHIQ